MNCILCNTRLYEMADEYFFICENCGAYVKDTKHYVSSKREKERYEEHNNDVNDVRYQNFTAPITDAILINQNKKQLGLDYGCGTGPVISKQIQDKGFQVKLYDPYFYPDQDYLNHKYDYIFSCEVFEHFYNPKQEIEKLIRILKPNGRLYIMTHVYNTQIDFKNWYYRKDPTHIFIYTQKTFDFIGDHYNMTIEKIDKRIVILKKAAINNEA